MSSSIVQVQPASIVITPFIIFKPASRYLHKSDTEISVNNWSFVRCVPPAIDDTPFVPTLSFNGILFYDIVKVIASTFSTHHWYHSCKDQSQHNRSHCNTNNHLLPSHLFFALIYSHFFLFRFPNI